MQAEELTVVIPTRDDPDIFACLQSIDAKVHVHCILNGSPREYVESVRQFLGQRFATSGTLDVLAEANLSAALQHGVVTAPTQRVLLMDSDCKFRPGALAAMLAAFTTTDPRRQILKGRVDFISGPGLLSQAIAGSRRQHTARRLSAYKPPLAFSREIANAIGGYFFDPRLRWKEDADLDMRVHRAGIEVVAVPGCAIEHRTLRMGEDLRSNFRYGEGAALGEALGIQFRPAARSIKDTFVHEGLPAAAYMSLANRVRSLGYWRTRLKLRRQRPSPAQ